MRQVTARTFWLSAAWALMASAGVGLLTYIGYRLHLDVTTTALLDLIAIVLLSLKGNFASSVVASLAAILFLNYFLIPPLRLELPLDAVSLAAFLVTALVITRLLSRLRQSLREVQTARDELRLSIDTIPALVWTTRPDGSSDFNNQRWLEYTGLSREQAEGTGYTKAIHPEDYDRLLPTWSAKFAAGEPIEDEARLRRADGVYRWFLHRSVPLRDKHGRIVKWYGTSTEIQDQKGAEELLRAQARLLDLTHDTVFVRDLNDVITFWNRGAEELYGWTRAEAVGKVSHELMQTVFPAPQEEITTALHRTGRWEGELMHTKRDGTQVTVASRWSLQRDEGGPVGTLETNNDITQRKRAEEAARRSERELRDVINAVPAHIWSSLPDGAVDFVNERWQEFTDLPLQEALGWKWAAAVHPDDRARFVADWRTALKNGHPLDSEVRLRRADGEYRWWFIRNVPLRDESGNILKWYATGIDIEDRKRAEQALKRSEAYLAEAHRLSHTGSWARDRLTGRVLYCSEELVRIFGFDSQDGVPTGEALDQRTHPDDREGVHKVVHDALRDKADYVSDFRIVLPDGTVRHLHVIGHPVLDETGEVVEYVGTAVDATERKRAEQALRRARERALKARFAAVLDERTRLAREIHDTLLQGFTGVALKLVAAMNRVTGLPEAAAALQDVVSLARKTLVDARRAVWDLRSPLLVGGDLPAALRGLAEAGVRGAGLTLEFEVSGAPRPVDPVVEAVTGRVLQEALTNVVKHASAGTVRVLLSFEARGVRLSVTDDGRGFVADPNLAGSGGHWGLLGMRERAAQVRGKLRLRSAPGQGTELVLLVPYAAERASRSGSAATPAS